MPFTIEENERRKENMDILKIFKNIFSKYFNCLQYYTMFSKTVKCNATKNLDIH